MGAVAPLLKVDGVSKRFCRDTARSLRYGVTDIIQNLSPLRQAPAVLRPSEFWSLDKISFEIQPGEAVAIGGRNGAGKTTLLRILAGLLRPDCGQISARGTINSVIELGQGLNPILTGRENAEIGLAWRGQDKDAIKALVPAVCDFAGLGEMFDAPVNTYSAGMRVRLAFAIAASIPCNLLLLDEVLAVGDQAFQRKCIDHMQRHLGRGGALILVSHNPVQMQALCRRGILLDQGKLLLDGSIEDCINQMFELQKAEQSGVVDNTKDDDGNRIDALRVSHPDGFAPIVSGDPVHFEIGFTLEQRLAVRCTFSLWTNDLTTCIAYFLEPECSMANAGENMRYCQLPSLPLAHGTYALRASVIDPETLLAIAHKGYGSAAYEFRISEPLSRKSLLTRDARQLLIIEHEWPNDQDRIDPPAVDRHH